MRKARVITLVACSCSALFACSSSDSSPAPANDGGTDTSGDGTANDGSTDSSTDGATTDSPPSDSITDGDASSHSGTRTVTHPRVVFDGTELDIKKYDLYVQPSSSSIDIGKDPAGSGSALHFLENKMNGGWNSGHVMVRPLDKRTGYTKGASLPEYEKSYHIKQKLYVGNDPQFRVQPLNLLEDNHCEPCEANNTQLMANTGDGADSICMWIIYSTDDTFDPRGTSRGGSYDPWPILGAHKTTLHPAADGTTSGSGLPPTGEIFLCRTDLHVSDIQGRWVEFEMLMKSSSYPANGQLEMWLDGRPYFFDGANMYRWNQSGKSGTSAATNTFQLGLYMDQVAPASGSPDHWEIWTSPPFIEVGDDIVYSP